jgi:hypothetical protein
MFDSGIGIIGMNICCGIIGTTLLYIITGECAGLPKGTPKLPNKSSIECPEAIPGIPSPDSPLVIIVND